MEAHYLLAIINSDVLSNRVAPFMSKGQFGARDLQKQLWKLPIPPFNPANPLHAEVSEAGKAAMRSVEEWLEATTPRTRQGDRYHRPARDPKAFTRIPMRAKPWEAAVRTLLGAP